MTPTSFLGQQFMLIFRENFEYIRLLFFNIVKIRVAWMRIEPSSHHPSSHSAFLYAIVQRASDRMGLKKYVGLRTF